MQALDKLHDSYDNPQIEYLKMASFVETFINDRGVSTGVSGEKTKQSKTENNLHLEGSWITFSLFHSTLIFLSAIIFVFFRYYDTMA